MAGATSWRWSRVLGPAAAAVAGPGLPAEAQWGKSLKALGGGGAHLLPLLLLCSLKAIQLLGTPGFRLLLQRGSA